MTANRIVQVLALTTLCSAPAWFGSLSICASRKTLPAPGFVYLAEEAALVPGRGNRMTGHYISEDGLTQGSEIVDNKVTLFEERHANAKTIFAVLAPLLSGDGFAVQKRTESVSAIDGLYPPYERLFFRSQNKQGPLFGGLVSAAPASIAGLVQQIRAICPAPSSQPKPTQAIFLQAALLDTKTAGEFRQNHLLRVVTENELASAPITAAAVHHPFQLIRTSDAETKNDSFVRLLNDRQPVLEIEYAGVAFQLTCLRTQNQTPNYE